MSPVEIIKENEISIGALESVFQRAFINAETTGDDQVWVKMESFLPVKIELDVENKMIKLESATGIKEAAPESEKYAFANRLNGALLVRFYILEGGRVLVGDYYLSYEGGLSAYQIVNTYRIFSRVFVGVLRSVYKSGGLLDI